jgi:hypothetical protein
MTDCGIIVEESLRSPATALVCNWLLYKFQYSPNISMKTKDVVGGKFGTHGKMRNAYRILVKNLESIT